MSHTLRANDNGAKTSWIKLQSSLVQSINL